MTAYTPTYTARAATAGEITKFRSNGNSSKLFAIFDVPVVVFTAQINGTFATHDMVAEIPYNNVSYGAITDCYYGMTVLISSALPANPDNTLGITYVRKAATATPLPVGESSEIPYADDLYITVLDEFGPWQDHIRVTSGATTYVRYDQAYTDEHTNFDPTPIIGSDRAARLPTGVGATVILSFAAASYVIDGSAVASHLWVFSGSIASTGLTTATPTATYSTAGRYKVKYTATAANGKSRTTWRDVYIYNDSTLITIDPKVDSCSWDAQSGGLEFTLTVQQDATLTNVRDRAKVLLIEEAIYGGTAGSIGPLVGSENIVAIGWLDDETVTLDWLRGEITFTAKTAHYWLGQEDAFILGYRLVNSTPADWIDFQGLTIDLALWDALMWRSTVSNFCDIQFTADARYANELTAPQGSLWSQIVYIAENAIFARPYCDNYSRIFIETPINLLPTANRASIPTVITLSTDDYENATLTRVTVRKTSRVALSGVAVSSNGGGTALFSLSDGHIFNRLGSLEVIERMLLSSQAQSNQLAADYKAWKNKPYQIEINGLTNNRLIGVCPHQYIVVPVVASDTLRNVTYSGNAIVTHVEWEHDPATGVWMTNLSCDPETTGTLSIDGDVPVVDDDSIDIPDMPPLKPLPPLPPIYPPYTPVPMYMICALVEGQGIYYMNYATASVYQWVSANDALTGAQQSGLLQLALGPTGIAYVATAREVYAIQLEACTYKSIVATEAYLLTYVPDSTTTMRVSGLCIDRLNPGIVGVIASRPYPTYLTGGFIGSGTVTYKYTLAIGYEASYISMSRYGGNWFTTANEGVFFATNVQRLAGDFSVSENTLGVDGPQMLYHVHARDADYIYAWDEDFHRITSNGETIDMTSVGGGVNSEYDCDPTGQYLMHVANDTPVYVAVSTDYGDSFTQLTNLPATSPCNYCRVLNLGSPTEWCVSYVEETGAPGVTVLYVFITTDGGTTWIDATGNLRDLVGATGKITKLQYA